MEPVLFVPLTQGKVAVIDFSDRWVLEREWCAAWTGNRRGSVPLWYAMSGRGVAQFLMHRVIMAAGQGQKVDHRDGNGLNNCRTNLRIATYTQNAQNRRKIRSAVGSRFKGVCPRSGNWCARITVQRKLMFIGYFHDELDAARAYDTAALKHFGEFALTNAMLGLLP